MDKHPLAPSTPLPTHLAHVERLSERLGFPDLRGRRGLIVAILIDNLGTGIFLPFAVLYATVTAHIPIATTGLVLSLCAACALPTAPVAGALVDRYGARRLVVIANLLQALGFAGYPLIWTPAMLFVCGCAVAVGNQAYFAANGSLIAQIAEPDQRARWFALLGACRSAGLGGGALLSGIALALLSGGGYQLLAEANALSFVVAAILIARVATPGVRSAIARTTTAGIVRVNGESSLARRALTAAKTVGGYRAVLRDGPFLGFTATNVAFSLIVLSFSIALPIYILGPLHLPIWAPGVVFSVNTALAVTAQTTVARWCERYRRTRALAFSAGLFTLAMLLLAGLAYAPHRAGGWNGWALLGLAVALLVYSAAVLIMAPLKNALIADAAPDALRGRYLAFYHLSWSVASTIGPASLTALLALGGGWLWLALAGVALVALLALCHLDHRLPLHAVRAPHSARLRAQ
jgi:MFS family permease